MTNGANLDRGSPTGAHRDPPHIAPPDSWRSLRNARVPPVDSVDDRSVSGGMVINAKGVNS